MIWNFLPKLENTSYAAHISSLNHPFFTPQVKSQEREDDDEEEEEEEEGEHVEGDDDADSVNGEEDS